MEYIKRHLQTTLEATANSFGAVLVTGARQVGKTTLLKQVFSATASVSLDDPVLLEQATLEPALFIQNNTPPLLLDEVQYAPHLFPYIKLRCDSTDATGLYLMTGSQQFHLMRNVSESLAGRIGILELLPLSLREIQRSDFKEIFIPTTQYIEKRKPSVVKTDIWELIHKGSYPAMQDNTIPWQQFFGSYLRTYIERDINQLSQVRDRTKFMQFMTALAARTAQLLNYQAVADELELSVNTVKGWVSLLEASGIIILLQPYTHSALHRAIKTPKIYFRDTGLVCYLTRWSDARAAGAGAMSGNLFETFVVNEILKSFANQGIDYRFHVTYYRGKDRKKIKEDGEERSIESEIDLIIEENGVLYPIEIKLTANPKASMAAAFDVLDKVPGYRRGCGAIICLYETPISLRENLFVIPAAFL